MCAIASVCCLLCCAWARARTHRPPPRRRRPPPPRRAQLKPAPTSSHNFISYVCEFASSRSARHAPTQNKKKTFAIRSESARLICQHCRSPIAHSPSLCSLATLSLSTTAVNNTSTSLSNLAKHTRAHAGARNALAWKRGGAVCVCRTRPPATAVLSDELQVCQPAGRAVSRRQHPAARHRSALARRQPGVAGVFLVHDSAHAECSFLPKGGAY